MEIVTKPQEMNASWTQGEPTILQYDILCVYTFHNIKIDIQTRISVSLSDLAHSNCDSHASTQICLQIISKQKKT